MDKVVDHLLVFNGDAKIKDFPGNYTDYREWRELEEEEQREQAKLQEKKTAPKPVEKKEQPRKLTYKEKKELEALEVEIPQLEEEKADIETQLSSGTLSGDEITALSKRYEELSNLIDEKTMRWLELEEI
jgi:ATP-binding cassette subfamily F protein uup